MKTTKKIVALVIAMMIISAMAVSAFAVKITIKAPTGSGTDNTTYTWYRILEADIAGKVSGTVEGGQTGKAAYYVTTPARARAISGTGLFNVVQVGDDSKWYVELRNSGTSAAEIAEKFAAMNKSPWSGTYTGSENRSGTAEVEIQGPGAGYYFIESTLGSNIILATLGEDVKVTEKNKYPTHDKQITNSGTDANMEIGKKITYTLTVEVPKGSNDQIVLTDTLSKGLKFVGFSGATDIPEDGVKAPSGTKTYPAENSGTYFTITWDSGTVSRLGVSGTIMKIYVIAEVTKDAVINEDIPNTLDLEYGNKYKAVPKEVKTKTTRFEFDKIDSSGSKLTGAEFKLLRDKNDSGSAIELIELESGTVYRIADSSESGSGITVIKTIGKTVTIEGLDLDLVYWLLETKAPTGFNKLTDAEEVKRSGTVFPHKDIENNKGSVLPSTGGMGTTILYIAGAILVLGAGILLVTKRRANY